MAACEVSSEGRIPSEGMAGNGEETEIPDVVNDADLFQKDINVLSVQDVYSIAVSVGKEFEKITDAFGGAIFSDIMPKIIRVLEMLESYASRSQNCSTDVLELQAMVQKLQLEGHVTTKKHQEDLDLVENAWREETRQLLQSVEMLKEDNGRLTQLLTEKLDGPDELKNSADHQPSVVGVLSESMEKSRDELREKNRVIEQQAAECEALSSQAQQVTKLNVNLRRKVALMEKQAGTMATKNTDLESTCKEKDRQIKELQKRVAELASHVKNGATSSGESKNDVSEKNDATTSSLDDPLLANKIVIDMDDPDRPRYTMHELQEVLNERNQFKLRCILLEDENSYFKQFVGSEGKEYASWEEIDDEAVEIVSPVQEVNNNNHENENKSDSVIKKLFASIFSRNAKSPAIPHESSKHSLPSYVRYDLPMLDMSDVMPTLDITPSSDEDESTETEFQAQETNTSEGVAGGENKNSEDD